MQNVSVLGILSLLNKFLCNILADIIDNGINQQSIKLIESRQKQMAIKWCQKYELRFNKM